MKSKMHLNTLGTPLNKFQIEEVMNKRAVHELMLIIIEREFKSFNTSVTANSLKTVHGKCAVLNLFTGGESYHKFISDYSGEVCNVWLIAEMNCDHESARLANALYHGLTYSSEGTGNFIYIYEYFVFHSLEDVLQRTVQEHCKEEIQNKYL